MIRSFKTQIQSLSEEITSLKKIYSTVIPADKQPPSIEEIISELEERQEKASNIIVCKECFFQFGVEAGAGDSIENAPLV
jgi:hypothetical protein